ncbi:hypothetical protein [Micromonospora okii]|uniref:hypothetical protein n=1 Tax=Micromonospora okii TaxID=1182970 RepID=UPI001E4D134E|nr:hypothetical protein [Micromonospora okii]
MSGTTHHRSSHDAVAPSDVTDTLLWRLAYDVAEAHQPDEHGRCPNLLCEHQPAPCAPLANAERAMRLSRGGADAAPQRSAYHPFPAPAQATRRSLDERGREAA